LWRIGGTLPIPFAFILLMYLQHETQEMFSHTFVIIFTFKLRLAIIYA